MVLFFLRIIHSLACSLAGSSKATRALGSQGRSVEETSNKTMGKYYTQVKEQASLMTISKEIGAKLLG